MDMTYKWRFMFKRQPHRKNSSQVLNTQFHYYQGCARFHSLKSTPLCRTMKFWMAETKRGDYS